MRQRLGTGPSVPQRYVGACIATLSFSAIDRRDDRDQEKARSVHQQPKPKNCVPSCQEDSLQGLSLRGAVVLCREIPNSVPNRPGSVAPIFRPDRFYPSWRLIGGIELTVAV